MMVWFWAEANTKNTTVEVIKINFSPPAGSNSIISPFKETVTVTFHGSRSEIEAAKVACSDGLTITVPTTDGTPNIDLASRIAQLDAIRQTGVEITDVDPKSISLIVKTMVSVEAVVVPVLNDVQISGDVTVDPATVTLLIPSSVRDTLPEAIQVTASLSPNELALLQGRWIPRIGEPRQGLGRATGIRAVAARGRRRVRDPGFLGQAGQRRCAL